MKRHTFVYLFITLFIGLTMVSFVFHSLPLAAETLNAPVGLTETFTPAPTNTSVPVATNTPVPAATNTPAPVATNTPVPAATNTPVPAATNTPVPALTNTPVPVVGLPNTGGAAPQGGAAPWVLVLAAAVVGSLGALAFGLRRAFRPTVATGSRR